MPRYALRALLITLTLSLSAACGRGELEPPPTAPATDMQTAQDMPVVQDMPDMQVAQDMQSTPDMAVADMGSARPIYQSAGDPYAPGALQVTARTIAASAGGPPVDVTVYAPVGPGRYPMVIFQHGFLVSRAHYSALLEHVATHGFFVVAPQMYAADGNPFGKPSSVEEAQLAAQVLTWARGPLAQQTVGQDVEAAPERFGLAGHSRGAKVVWTLLKSHGAQPQAIAGVDPVDGTGGPLGGESRVLDGLRTAIPALILGTGKGPESSNPFQPACAPAGDNYAQFYAAADAPAWQVIAPDHGHMDMLNDQTTGCGLVCTACPAGASRAPMRQLTAGLLVSLMRGALQDQPGALQALDGSGAPITVQATSR